MHGRYVRFGPTAFSRGGHTDSDPELITHSYHTAHSTSRRPEISYFWRFLVGSANSSMVINLSFARSPREREGSFLLVLREFHPLRSLS